MIPGKPTLFGDIQYRSLAEANWSCCFVRWLWNWIYEPIIIPGRSRGWIPDFLIGNSPTFGENPIPIEIKPYYTVEEFSNIDQIKYSYYFDDVILFPADPLYFIRTYKDRYGEQKDEPPVLGFLNQYRKNGERILVPLHFGFTEKGILGLCPETLYDASKWTKVYNTHPDWRWDAIGVIQKAWNEAKNKTQWRPKHISD
jgi:hypothetical protein